MGKNLSIVLVMLMLATIPSYATGVAARTTLTEKDGTTDVVFLGDSNTWLGGDSCDRPEGWSKWLCERIKPSSCRSYARSGATWTNTRQTVSDTGEYSEVIGDNNVIFNQVNRLKENFRNGMQPYPDIIFILAGTNDAWFAKARPGALKKTVNEVFDENDILQCRQTAKGLSMAEAIKSNCGQLAETFPNARIILITPMLSAAVAEERISRAGDIIEGCARRMGMEVIRLDNAPGAFKHIGETGNGYTSDGTHTTEKGARLAGYYVADKIKTIITDRE